MSPDALPRQWTDADLRRRLSGRSLLNTILREKMGLEREYVSRRHIIH